jgi:hypothetical protein
MGMATFTSTGLKNIDDYDEAIAAENTWSVVYRVPTDEFVDITQNDIDSQWILREGRKFRFDAPKKVIPRQKKFNRRMMKCNRMEQSK